MTTTGSFTRWCRTCGWKGTYGSASKADYCKRRHSCARWIAKAVSAERGQARKAAVDRAPKPCNHPIASHVHGTHACYVLDRCKCDPCSAANAAYEQNRARQNAYGRANYVDAGPSRAHIKSLTDQGMGLKRIVAVSDISQGVLWKLVYGKVRADGTRVPSVRVRKDTETRILAITLDLADGATVPTHGTRRRLQALVSLGYSQSVLADRLGVLNSNLGKMLHHQSSVTKATAEAVTRLYDELSMTPRVPVGHREKVSVSRARNYASWMMWAPPLAWDDDTIDDPFAEPESVLGIPVEADDAAVWRAINGDRTVELTNEDRLEVVRVLHGRGCTDVEMAELLGKKTHVISHIRKQLELKPNAGTRVDWSEYGERPRVREQVPA